MAKQSNPKSPVAEIITDLILIQPLNEVVANSGLEKSKAEKYALGYAPLMREVIEQSDLLKPLDKTKPEDAAKAKRISLDLGKICSRLTIKKKEDKDTLLIETRLIDGLFNVAESTARLTQKEADAIVDYLDNIEKERLSALADMRRAELEKYEADTTYLPLDIMGDDQYARCLESAQLAFEARKITAEKLEAERLQAIKDAELAEQERLRLQAERIENERLEAIRIKEELAAKEQELVKEREANAEKEKLRILEENKAIKLRDELRKRFATYAVKDITPFGFTLCENGIENKELGWFIGCRHYDGFDSEPEMKEWVKDIQDRARIMIVQKSEAEKKQLQIENQNAETELLKKELQAKKDAEEKQRKANEAQAKAEEEKRTAALRAPDKEKVRMLFDQIKAITIPEFGTMEGQQLGQMVLGALKILQADIINESKKLL